MTTTEKPREPRVVLGEELPAEKARAHDMFGDGAYVVESCRFAARGQWCDCLICVKRRAKERGND